ncbi:hypothetical protein [Pseudoalteromonas sp.]|uniref:hypothetical protein n=1 Tax=Pseudoalteromonas sp. TaxID=53249 RepID=UPI003002A281
MTHSSPPSAIVIDSSGNKTPLSSPDAPVNTMFSSSLSMSPVVSKPDSGTVDSALR